MGSAGSPNSWAPYYSYRDCSQGICSIYCRQWCYVVFPPPPPFVPPDVDADSTPNFSPLIIAVIGILAGAFLLTTYYTIISKYCNRARRRRDDQNPAPEFESGGDQTNPAQAVSTGLDETLIKSIAVCKYKKGDGLVEGTECSVCLSEFQEDESLRLLPKCSHAFHLNCIDTWLKSQSNCPLCRASVVKLPPPPNTSVQTSSSALDVIIPSLQIHPQNDLILVVDNDDDRDQRVHSEEEEEEEEEEVATARQIRRSISLGSFAFRGHLLVADILHINEDDEDVQMGINRIRSGVGTSRGEASSWENSRNEALKRSITTGRFSFRKA